MRTISQRAQEGFTLLELLIVVAVLAIIGGGILVAYDELDDKVSEGVSAHTIAGLDSAVRNYTATAHSAPNDLDALMAADYSTDPAAALTNGEKVAILPDKLLGSKTLLYTLTAPQVAALKAAGITSLRYVDIKGNDLTSPDPNDPAATPVTLDALDPNGDAGVVGALLKIDIPSRIHEPPRPGTGMNRGRGFSKPLYVGDPVLRWNPTRDSGSTDGGYDNIKIGANPNDVILVFGLGNDATCVGASEGRVQITSAPVYGKVKPERYGRYLLLYNIGPEGDEFAKARLQVVMNSHGDFIDEMIAEHGGQKS